MKATIIARLVVTLCLLGFGLVGVVDHVRTMPGWAAARAEAMRAGPMVREYSDALQRDRTIGLVVSVGSLCGGVVLGLMTYRIYVRSSAGSMTGRAWPTVCTICGATLSHREQVGGLCRPCQERAG
jgi:hypothetical protein